MKTCAKCGDVSSQHLYFKTICKPCYRRDYDNNNRAAKNARNRKYKKAHRTQLKNYSSKYRASHPAQVSKNTTAYKIRRIQKDPLFKMRSIISASIRSHLKLNGYSKQRKSTLKFLPYTIQELKEHLEKLFEPWMTWDNRGLYKVNEWNDTDQSTWKWQLDHIVPHSTFKYTSMEDQSFKECWALYNLRPYSAKQNLLDSNKR
jgi:hypothetical protein